MSEIPYIRVSEVMTREVPTIEALATVREALKVLDETGVSSLVIERRNEEDELGLIAISDIASKVMAENRSPDRVNVYEIMRKPVLTIDRDMDIRYAIRLLDAYGGSRGWSSITTAPSSASSCCATWWSTMPTSPKALSLVRGRAGRAFASDRLRGRG